MRGATPSELRELADFCSEHPGILRQQIQPALREAAAAIEAKDAEIERLRERIEENDEEDAGLHATIWSLWKACGDAATTAEAIEWADAARAEIERLHDAMTDAVTTAVNQRDAARAEVARLRSWFAAPWRTDD